MPFDGRLISPPVRDENRPVCGWRDIGFHVFLRAANALLRLPGHTFRLAVLRRLCDVSIGPGTTIDRGVRVMTRGGVTIGRRCVINSGVVLDGRGSLTIGNEVNVSPEALFLTADHDVDSVSFAGRLRSVTIGSQCWIATRAIVLPGSIVGEGAVVAAGAVVAGDVVARTVVAGAPARKVRDRPPDAQTQMGTYRRWFH